MLEKVVMYMKRSQVGFPVRKTHFGQHGGHRVKCGEERIKKNLMLKIWNDILNILIQRYVNLGYTDVSTACCPNYLWRLDS